MTRTAVLSDQAPDALGPYSQEIVAGGMIYCSGMAGIDPATGAVADGIEAQTEQALLNLAAIAGRRWIVDEPHGQNHDLLRQRRGLWTPQRALPPASARSTRRRDRPLPTCGCLAACLSRSRRSRFFQPRRASLLSRWQAVRLDPDRWSATPRAVTELNNPARRNAWRSWVRVGAALPAPVGPARADTRVPPGQALAFARASPTDDFSSIRWSRFT
jgi:hypothetical protein